MHDGKPNPKNSSHIYHLKEILIEHKWPFSVIDKLLYNLTEQETKFKGRTKDGALRYNKTKDALDKALEKGTVKPVDDKETEKDTSNLVTKKGVDAQLAGDRDAEPGDKIQKVKQDKADATTTEPISGINAIQTDLENKRDKGDAGQGGPVASQGESRYCNACL